MVEKDFQLWHERKCRIHNGHARVFFQEREIWFCHLGENIGFEQDGRGDEYLRPVIILKKFNQDIFWAVPLTKGDKRPKPYYYVFSFQEGILSGAILSQLRLIDVKRLKYKTGTMKKTDFIFMKTKIKHLFA